MKRIILLIVLTAIYCSTEDLASGLDANFKLADEYMHSILDTASTKDLFKLWHDLYKPNYLLSGEDTTAKYKAFKDNLKLIRETNAKNLGYTFGLNQFSDETKEQFASRFTKRVPEDSKFLEDLPKFERKEELESTATLEPIDHRGSIGPARDQGSCGSCWTYAATGACEGNYAIQKKVGGPIEYMSTQQLMDCDTSNNGCSGGTALKNARYLLDYGLMPDNTYPYVGKQGSRCKYAPERTIRPTGFDWCSNYRSDNRCTKARVHQILQNGPSQVGIDSEPIQHYRNGVYYTTQCVNDNHAVVMVGYGVSSQGEYWTIRNSWGPKWGEQGHIRVHALSANNACIVENESVRPDFN
jgi:hypothetical protein